MGRGVKKVKNIIGQLGKWVSDIGGHSPFRGSSAAGSAICGLRLGVIRFGFDCVRILSKIRRERSVDMRLMRTSLEHLRPVKARLWVLVGTTIHGHPILTGGHAIARHLLVVHVGVVAVRLRTTHDRARDGPPIGLVAIVKSADAVGARELILVVGHVVHTVVNGDHAEGVNHAVVGHVVKPVKLVEVALIAHGSVLLLLVLLDVSLRVRQVTDASGVTTADGTLLEVAFQDIATREGITAQNAHVRAITGVCEVVLANGTALTRSYINSRLRRWRLRCFAWR